MRDESTSDKQGAPAGGAAASGKFGNSQRIRLEAELLYYLGTTEKLSKVSTARSCEKLSCSEELFFFDCPYESFEKWHPHIRGAQSPISSDSTFRII